MSLVLRGPLADTGQARSQLQVPLESWIVDLPAKASWNSQTTQQQLLLLPASWQPAANSSLDSHVSESFGPQVSWECLGRKTLANGPMEVQSSWPATLPCSTELPAYIQRPLPHGLQRGFSEQLCAWSMQSYSEEEIVVLSVHWCI